MGRIKTAQIKRITHNLLDIYPNEFTDNFEKNQEIAITRVLTASKNLRNKITGYVARLVRKKNNQEIT